MSNAKNLGVIIDEELNFDCHINEVTSSCFHAIHKITRIKNFLKPEHLKTLVSSLILSKLDYCNALYLGCSIKNLTKLQLVQNSAARLVLKTNRFDHVSITDQIKHLHWLKIKEQITFKVLLISNKALIGIAPLNIRTQIAE